MASAVLVNRKDADWPPQHIGGAAGAGFMGKVPFANPNPKPNPTKGPKRSQFPFHAPSSGLSAGHYNNGCQIDESPAVTQTASDDASSINHHRRSGGGSGGGELGLVNSQYVSFSVRALSRKELGELKNQLSSELDRIRQLQRRIEAGELNHHQPPSKIKKPIPTKKLSGSKRPFPVNPTQPPKDPAPIPKRSHFENPNLMKNCGQLMTKLMKHKHAWVFNKPVDVVGMGLHDYYDIIKRPMDLGSVKTNLAKNLYSSVSNFASDVRLTFQNAMAYNPKGHEVHVMAEQLLSRFEELFGPLGERLASDRAHDSQASSWEEKRPEPERPMKKREEKRPEPALRAQPPPPPPPPAPAPAPLVHAPASSSKSIPNSPPVAQSPVRTPSPPMRTLPVKPLKQPKPKAKDPNKREMNMEEKHKLGVGLQSLPQEKMEQVVQIIKKRNGHLKQDGDEIELDIEAVDTETLWELDRLVTNYKKMVSKVKRQALMTNLNPNNVTHSKPNVRELPVSEKMEFTATTTSTMAEPKRAKKGEAGDEDVDIGDDLPMSSFPPVEIEKDEKDVGVSGGGGGGGDGGGGPASSSSSSGSSSSSSDSSSSSGSDSGSSSGSDSDDDNAHS